MQKSLSSSELRKILETTNERDLFMVGHIYIENTIDRILEKDSTSPQSQLTVRDLQQTLRWTYCLNLV